MKKYTILIFVLFLFFSPISPLRADSISQTDVNFSIENLQVYQSVPDSTGKKMVVTLFDLQINPKNDVDIAKDGSSFILKNKTTASGTTTIGTTNIQDVSSNMIDNGDFYTVPAGSTSTVSLMSLFDQAPGNSYFHDVGTLWVGFAPGINGWCGNSIMSCSAGTSMGMLSSYPYLPNLTSSWACTTVGGNDNICTADNPPTRTYSASCDTQTFWPKIACILHKLTN